MIDPSHPAAHRRAHVTPWHNALAPRHAVTENAKTAAATREGDASALQKHREGAASPRASGCAAAALAVDSTPKRTQAH
jgi:hypothetical protein